MVECLIVILILSFFSLVIGVARNIPLIIVPQLGIILVVVYLLVRVRVKISKAEKEKLRKKIEELEAKIEGLVK
uniref:Uncharacterized protein n=1 Tax=candidate division WOR-3 bacterium TaxID=2052148 RepID=A0A7C4TH96_UNCW3